MNMVAIGKLPELLRFHAITRYDVLFRGSAAKEMPFFAELRRRNVVRVNISAIALPVDKLTIFGALYDDKRF